MRNKGSIKSICSVFLILLIVVALVLSSCAKETTPTAPGATTPGATSPAPTKPGVITPAVTTPSSTKPAPAPSAQIVKWKWQSNVAPGPSEWASEEWFIKWIEQYSDGRLTFTHYPAGQIVKSADYLDALKNRVVDVCNTYGGYYSNFIPEAGIAAGTPMTLRTITDMDNVFTGKGMIDLVREAFAPHGVYVMCGTLSGKWFVWAKKPVRTMADLQKLKVRGTGDVAKMLAALGAAVTFIPHEESYTALQLGTIDGYSTGISVYVDFKHYEICKYVMTPPLLFPAFTLYSCSKGSLDALEPDLRLFWLSQAPVFNWVHTWIMDAFDNKYLGMSNKLGFEFVPMSDEIVSGMTTSAVKILEDYGKVNARCVKMVDIIKAQMKEMGYIE